SAANNPGVTFKIHYTTTDVYLVDQTETAINVTTSALSATEGVALTNIQVATFTHADAGDTAATFTASINWDFGGTNDTSIGTVSGPNGGPYTVTGSHTYPEEFTNGTIKVTITEADDVTITGSGSAAANVADLAPTVSRASASVTGTEDVA